VRKKRQKWNNPSGTRTYYAWRSMRSRCDNPKNPAYHNYGGRGIAYDREWKSYDAFFASMGACPNGLTLDRVDYNSNYTTKNCRWVSWEVQQNNKRTNRRVTANGVTMTLSEWDKKLGLRPSGFSKRLERMSPDKAARAGSIRKQPTHGTKQMYDTHKCRCTDCRADNAKRAREYRKKQNERVGQIQRNETS